ncbi:DUF481 domain-containing protein [Halotalea alkalilenta]|uniref:DUF481 domain-containing protein n=1 Tax=Halotalea alkalilenta TaxID=376489 RepID=UPI00048855C4|nr:DUF481 domain-containing protein [Halotalea alkalilenta]
MSPHLFRTVPLLFGAAFAAASAPALADIADFDVLDDPASAEQPFIGKVELGYTGHTGNSDASSLNAATTMTWFSEPWSYSLWASANSASSGDETTAERYALGGRSRYNLSSQNYLFSQLSWQSNRFAGYQNRYTLAGGYGRQVLIGPPHSFSYEFGPGVRHDDLEEDGTETRMIGYGAINYGYQFSDTARFTQGVATEIAGNNTTTTAESALSVSINSNFTLRVAYSVEHNDSPPEGTDHKTDTTTTVSLVYGL